MSVNKPQTNYTISIDGTDYTEYIPMPFKWSSLLDERLDEGRMSMRHCPVPLFAPMSEVKIMLSDKNNTATEKVFLVSADDSTEAPAGSGYYNHEIMLIEETKKLEGIIIDSLTFTNSLGRAYADNSQNIFVSVEDDYKPFDKRIFPDEDKIAEIEQSLTPKLAGQSFTFMSLKSLYSSYASANRPTADWTIAQFTVKFNNRNIYI